MESSPAPDNICAPVHLGIKPAERLNPAFPALGGNLAQEFESVDHAKTNIRYVQLEMRRLEQSIATVFGTHARHLDTTDPIRGVLECLVLQVNDGNLSVIQQTLLQVIVPLAPWTTAVIRDSEQQLAFAYASYVGLLNLSKAILELGVAPSDQLSSVKVWYDQAKRQIELVDGSDMLVSPKASGKPEEGDTSARSGKGLFQNLGRKLGGNKHE